nr:hypothetical protein [Roseovarius sp. M141]
MTDFDTLFQAMTAHTTRVAEKLGQHGLLAGTLTMFLHINRHRMDQPQYAGCRTPRLTPMSSDIFDLVDAVRRCAQAFMVALDQVSERFGEKTVVLANEGRGSICYSVSRKTSITAFRETHATYQRCTRFTLTECLGSKAKRLSL